MCNFCEGENAAAVKYTEPHKRGLCGAAPLSSATSIDMPPGRRQSRLLLSGQHRRQQQPHRRDAAPPTHRTPRSGDAAGRSLCVSKIGGLLAEAKGLDDGTVALDVLVLKVVEEGAALTYKCYEGTFGSMIFTVGLHVFRQMGNTV